MMGKNKPTPTPNNTHPLQGIENSGFTTLERIANTPGEGDIESHHL